MIDLISIYRETVRLENQIARLVSMVDINKTVISVSNPDFRIIYVPKGAEDIAKMELNETLK